MRQIFKKTLLVSGTALVHFKNEDIDDCVDENIAELQKRSSCWKN